MTKKIVLTSFLVFFVFLCSTQNVSAFSTCSVSTSVSPDNILTFNGNITASDPSELSQVANSFTVTIYGYDKQKSDFVSLGQQYTLPLDQSLCPGPVTSSSCSFSSYRASATQVATSVQLDTTHFTPDGIYKLVVDNGNGLNCQSTYFQTQVATVPQQPNPNNGNGGSRADSDINPIENNQSFDTVDPLRMGGSNKLTQAAPSEFANILTTPGGIITRLLQFAIPAAGLILFVMLIWGGFEILAGAATAKSKDAGRQRITAAIIGFVLLFASYWIVQIIQLVFNVRILN